MYSSTSPPFPISEIHFWLFIIEKLLNRSDDVVTHFGPSKKICILFRRLTHHRHLMCGDLSDLRSVSCRVLVLILPPLATHKTSKKEVISSRRCCWLKPKTSHEKLEMRWWSTSKTKKWDRDDDDVKLWRIPLNPWNYIPVRARGDRYFANDLSKENWTWIAARWSNSWRFVGFSSAQSSPAEFQHHLFSACYYSIWVWRHSETHSRGIN